MRSRRQTAHTTPYVPDQRSLGLGSFLKCVRLVWNVASTLLYVATRRLSTGQDHGLAFSRAGGGCLFDFARRPLHHGSETNGCRSHAKHRSCPSTPLNCRYTPTQLYQYSCCHCRARPSIA